ncbi:MAG: heparinase II/III family protein [Ignavibacteria bacterium]
MNLRKARLYFDTLRHLKPVQVWGRMAFRVRRPSPDLRPAPPRRAPTGRWTAPAERLPSMTAPHRFRFLNEDHEVAAAADWNDPALAKLLLYNVHYFDDLNALGAAERSPWHEQLIRDWIEHNPPACGTGWEPYPLSLRIVNWIKRDLGGRPLDETARQSLAVQVRYLSQRLEHHLLGNHLFSNAKALVFAGCHFEGVEAANWLTCGLEILSAQIPEQILADGGHFERSTMYHALAYEDMLDLVNLAATFPEALAPWAAAIAGWRERPREMGKWLAAMCHPDGEIAFFNDAAPGVAPAPARLFDYAERLGYDRPAAGGDGVTWLKPSGYVRLQSGPAVVLIDVAPVGPDYLPGHAHADTLSFELSLGGQRVIVNSGTSRYGVGPERQRERATAAHSTVEVDGQDSSEVWGGFRVARRARVFDVCAAAHDAVLEVRAAHDGYARLAGRPIHRRTWRLSDGALEVADRIEGDCRTAVARYHFHPAIDIGIEGSGGSVAGLGGDARWSAEAGDVAVRKSAFAPAFGKILDNSCLEVRLVQREAVFRLGWDSRGRPREEMN